MIHARLVGELVHTSFRLHHNLQVILMKISGFEWVKFYNTYSKRNTSHLTVYRIGIKNLLAISSHSSIVQKIKEKQRILRNKKLTKNWANEQLITMTICPFLYNSKKRKDCYFMRKDRNPNSNRGGIFSRKMMR